MEQIIYGDVLFIINFSMDFLSLFITEKLLHRKPSASAMILSAALGSIYAVASLFVSFSGMIATLLHISVALLMCYIVNSGGIWELVKTFILFFSVNFLLGGGMTALYNLFNARRDVKRVIVSGEIETLYSEIPVYWFIILAAVCAIISFIWGRIIERLPIKSITVLADCEGRHVEFSCLPDTGNLLSEPLSGTPVIISRYEIIEPIIPHRLRKIIKCNDIDALAELDITLMKRVKLIPMTSVGGGSLIIALTPDKLLINGAPREACLACTPKDNDCIRLSGYDAIAPTSLI